MGRPSPLQEILAPVDGDHEDVAWALHTANVQWSRGYQDDAVEWLRRAVEFAADAGHAPRAIALADAVSRLATALPSSSAEASVSVFSSPRVPADLAQLAADEAASQEAGETLDDEPRSGNPNAPEGHSPSVSAVRSRPPELAPHSTVLRRDHQLPPEDLVELLDAVPDDDEPTLVDARFPPRTAPSSAPPPTERQYVGETMPPDSAPNETRAGDTDPAPPAFADTTPCSR